MRSVTATSILLLALAPLAVAQPREVTGVLRRDPLRLAINAGPTLRLVGPTELTSAIDAPANDGLVVRGTILPAGAGATIASLAARAQGDVTVRTEPRADAPVAARLRSQDALRIVGASDGCFKVLARSGGVSVTGWLPVRLVALGVDNRAGALLGEALAPAFEAGSEARRARFFHPDGHTYSGVVTALAPADAPLLALGQKLAGSALLRIGGGIWRLDEHGAEPEHRPDALSLAIRFRAANAPLSTETAAGDQDLLLSSWAERFGDFLNGRSLLGTDAHDFLANTYFPAMPFLLEGVKGECWLRIRPLPGPTGTGANRIAKLDDAIRQGGGRFAIEVQRRSRVRDALTGDLARFVPGASTVGLQNPWIGIAELRLTGPVAVDQKALRFHPGLAGRGLRPTGLIMSIREAVYRRSQDGRARTEGLVDRVR